MTFTTFPSLAPLQKGGKMYFHYGIRNKFQKLKDAKNYISAGFKNFKSKLLEWKGRLLRAKGNFLTDKGEKLIEYALQKYTPLEKGKGGKGGKGGGEF